jgi:Spy/CpxP family protein refolding chaperone
MKKLSVIAMALVFSFISIGPMQAVSHAHRKGGGMEQMHGRGGGGHHKFMSKLNLTQEQKREIAAILKANRDEIESVAKGMSDARRAMKEATAAEEFNEQAVRSAALQAAEQRVEYAALRAKIMSQVKPVLTPEQQEIISNMKAKKQGRHRGGSVEAKLSALDKWIAENSN